ncbi:hypothetical protein AYO20_08857 [Fonsecaea nubica]|uniref:Uncharacterized protein n=1 Tax=Fonsecaea nubica TaxID=856822 RepID=A0A178CMU6_9EURO|nr:hypothetical protein AYO20_08857 [Fonsecaea nubica]OAL30141.1 hypothetical protein AYO20_08857 [Fonsecaea nubica]
MAEFRQQEMFLTSPSETTRSAMVEENWNNGSFWFFHALETTKGFYNMSKQNVMPRFSGDDSSEFPDISLYWSSDVDKMIRSKLDERERYLQRLSLAAVSTDSDSDG